MRAFLLKRDEDVTGVSGTGIVAEGVEWVDKTVTVRWCVGEHRSTVNWDSLHAVEKIHGHDGKTRIVFVPTFEFPGEDQ
jgi:hypothetical protein